MRAIIAVCLVVPAAAAHAEVSIGAQVGAGAQDNATYSAIEARLDAAWDGGHVGLGARGVWTDAEFRERDWDSPWSVVTIVRDATIAGRVDDLELAAAAGALAPAKVGRIVDGYRVALDDRWRTGVRLAARSTDVDAGAEVDDVLDPRMVVAGVSWRAAEPWGITASVAIDPGTSGAGELGGFRRFEAKQARLDVGTSLVVTPDPSGVVFAAGAVERARVRWTARTDVRLGRGGLFGPLYRIEGVDERWGVGAGVAAGVASERGWLELGARRRPGLGGLYTLHAGAPMGRSVQAGAWAAMTRDAAAGAAELRVVWSKRLFSALHGARMYRTDEMSPMPVWSVTAWFGAASL